MNTPDDDSFSFYSNLLLTDHQRNKTTALKNDVVDDDDDAAYLMADMGDMLLNYSKSIIASTLAAEPDVTVGVVVDPSVGQHRPYDIELFDEDAYCRNLDFSHNLTYLNVSCETNLDYSVPLYGFCSPFLLFTTVLANTLIVLVLSKRNMATPTNSVLMGELLIYYLNFIKVNI